MTNMDIAPEWTGEIGPEPEEDLPAPEQPRVEWHSPPPPIPPAITKALSGVMAAIKKLHKGDVNQYQRYAYTSADTFFEAVGPLLAAEGLIIIPQQVGWETRTIHAASEGPRGDGPVKPKVVLILDWDFYLAHSSGAMWSWPLRRTIMADSGGPQKWGGAQTYVLKQFLRALLLIPTGDDPPDKDADKSGDADAEQGFKGVPPPRRQQEPTQSDAPDPATPLGLTPVEAMNAFQTALAKEPTEDSALALLRQFRNKWERHLTKPQIYQVVDNFNKHVVKHYTAAKIESSQNASRPE